MGEKALELKDSDLDKIVEYVKSRISEWIDPDIFKNQSGRSRELDLVERMIRVEEELKSQRELIKLGFEQMDRRFVSMDHRFESLQKQMDARFAAVDMRFESLQKQMDERFKAMDSRFETMQKYMDARFEQVDKRFEQIDKKFNTITVLLALGFTVLSLLIAFVK